MTRRRLLLLFLPALLMGVLAAVVAWFLRSESGAAWVWQRVVASVPGELRAARLEGTLQTGLRLARLAYRQDGFSLDADQVAFRLDLDLLPPSVTVEELRVANLDMQSEISSETNDPVDWSWIPALELPLPVTFHRAHANRLTWAETDSPPLVDLRELSFTLNWHHSLDLEQARFDMPDSQWQLSTRIALQAPHELELAATGDAELPALAAAGTRLEVRARGAGSLSSSHWMVTVPERQLSLSGDLDSLLDEPGWDLQLEAPRLAGPPGESSPAWVVEDLFLSSYGNAGEYDVEATALASGEGIPAVAIRLVGEGSGSEILFELVDAEGQPLTARGTGRLAWAPSVQAAADLEVGRFDPAIWMDAWGEAPAASGAVRLRWQDEALTFTIPAARAPGTLEQFQAEGSLNTVDGVLSVDLGWQNLAWPPGADSPQLASEAGQVRLAGALEDWTVEGALTLSGSGFPTGRLQIEGSGDRNSVDLEIPEGQVLGGRLAGRFGADWSGATAWSAQARVNDISTGPLLPDFPGTVSGALAARGRAADEEGQGERLQIDIESLGGTVRGRTFRAEGGLERVGGLLNARGLQLRSGQSVIKADGNMQGAEGLSVDLDIRSMGDLLDGATGRFDGRGKLSLVAGRPRLALQGSGEDLVWNDLSAAGLLIDGAAGEGETLRLDARELQIGDTRLSRLQASAGGATPLEQLSVSMRFDEAEARVSLQGGVADWKAPLERGWTGRIEELRAEHPELGFIGLERPADLQLSAETATLGEACFRGSREGRLCLDGDRKDVGEFRLDAVLDQVSPNLAMRLLESELSFSQRLNGTVEWRRSPQRPPEGRVRLEVTPGRISEPGEDDPILTTGPGALSFDIADGTLHSGLLDVPLEGNGRIDANFRVPDLAAGAEATIEGRLQIDLESIEPLLRLVPGVEGRSGPVAADLRMGGSLANPKMTGHLSLVRGRLSHFASGLVLEDIRLAGAVYEYDQTELSGSFRAGEGQGTLRTVLNFNDPLSPEILLQVQGSQLTLVDVPDLRVIADPDLRLSWREGMLNVDGRVEVPSARLSPRYLPTAAAAESEDVVIVAGAESVPEELAEPSRDYRIQGRLELALGQDVQLLLDRATARLAGNAEFLWDGQLIPVANGSFGVSGEIKAYGQLLTVTDGRINFSGRPADNPFLNIRAEREIYGNTQVTQAGVRVTGTLKQPDLEVYTVPMTTRERALTMLVTGNDFSYEQGVGSVEVGMYVAPKLYISYGIGLFDDQNVISARYDLGKGFGVKTTSGQRETGADISYTIER